MNSCLNTQENGGRQRGIGTDSIFHIMERNTGYIHGSMYNSEDSMLSDGRVALFGIYKKRECKFDSCNQYELLGEYADMHDLLESRVIEGRPFSEVIMDDYTELLGQD